MRVAGSCPRPSVEDIIRLHDLTIAVHGGLPGIRDRGMLESAVGQIDQTFGGIELYPTIEEKAARLAFGIAMNHPFLDGNKRTAVGVMATFLRMCGADFTPPHKELLKKVLDMSRGALSPEDLAAWISTNVVTEESLADAARAALRPKTHDEFPNALDQSVNPRLTAFAEERTSREEL